MFFSLFHGYFWHPLQNGPGYNLWSGILGSFLVSVPTWLLGFGLFLVHRNCHVKGCLRLSWHPHPEHGHPVCKKHHPDGNKDLS